MVPVTWTAWLRALPLRGGLALICAVALVALPTFIRAALEGTVSGCEYTPFLPFVVVAAILLRWWQAGAVALASVALLGGLFVDPLHDPACFLSVTGIFLGASAIVIAVAALVRRLIATIQVRGADESSGDIVFSLEDGEVWASWYGRATPMRLGRQQNVATMMEDFLAQTEIGKRLSGRS